MTVVHNVSANWEDLLDQICRHSLRASLPDCFSDLYGFGNELLMREMSERLLETLETTWTNFSYGTAVFFGNKFFATMNEQQQRSFLRRIMALPVCMIQVGETSDDETDSPAITICTAALLDALTVLNPRVLQLFVKNFALSKRSDVEALSNSILAKREALQQIHLEGIECPMDYNNRDRDGPVGFLDPLLYASSRMDQLPFFSLSARTPPSRSSLVSPEAVRALASERRVMNFLRLIGLGLNDSHCHVIAEEWLASGSSVSMLSLKFNPAISAEGYSAFLGLINRTNAIRGISVDDAAWKAKLDLVSEMNRYHGRLEYMTDGAFSSDERRWQWLQKLASLPSSCSRWDNAKQINFLWYELVEHPEFMQT